MKEIATSDVFACCGRAMPRKMHEPSCVQLLLTSCVHFLSVTVCGFK